MMWDGVADERDMLVDELLPELVDPLEEYRVYAPVSGALKRLDTAETEVADVFEEHVPCLTDGVAFTGLMVIPTIFVVEGDREIDDLGELRDAYAAAVSVRYRHIDVRDREVLDAMLALSDRWEQRVGPRQVEQFVKHPIEIDAVTRTTDVGNRLRPCEGEPDLDGLDALLRCLDERAERLTFETVATILSVFEGEKPGGWVELRGADREVCEVMADAFASVFSTVYSIREYGGQGAILYTNITRRDAGFIPEHLVEDGGEAQEAIHRKNGRFFGYPEEAIEFYLTLDREDTTVAEVWGLEPGDRPVEELQRRGRIDAEEARMLERLVWYVFPDDEEMIEEALSRARRRRQRLEERDAELGVEVMERYHDRPQEVSRGRTGQEIIEEDLPELLPEDWTVQWFGREVEEAEDGFGVDAVLERHGLPRITLPGKDSQGRGFAVLTCTVSRDLLSYQEAVDAGYGLALDPDLLHAHLQDPELEGVVEALRGRLDEAEDSIVEGFPRQALVVDELTVTEDA